jgi:hypothetical protein
MNRSRTLALLLVPLLLLVTSRLLAAAGERCLSADVTWPIVFPDGKTRPAGTLTLCVIDYSPVAAYHRAYVDGTPITLLFSHRTPAEDVAPQRPYILFYRTDSDAMRLVGYVWPSKGRARSYLLQGEPWDPKASRTPAVEQPPPPDGSSPPPR